VLDNYENGKVALYTEDFYSGLPANQVAGNAGPMADNNYTGIQIGGGASAAATPFEVQLGEGTNTTGYLPMYYLYDNSLSTQLYLGTELAEAGATTAPMTSISWYSESTYGYDIQNISIWMANVTDTEAPAISPLGSSMTLVYQGNFQEVVGWNEFVFNAGNFAWDGTNNVLVMVQMNNGNWSSSIQWQCGNVGFTAGSYTYRDNTAYNAGSESYSLSTTTNRANTIFKGGNRNRSELTYSFEGGMQSWTTIDNDGNGENWFHSSQSQIYSGYDYTGLGHNDTDGFMVSASYSDITGYAIDADNYLVSPQKYTLGTGASLNFFFDYGSDTYPDYFEVCVATANNPTASSFTSVWNVNMRSNAAKTQIRHNNNRYLNWREVTVDLSAYAGQEVWIAFHHEDYDNYELWIDDVTINTGGDTPTPPTPPTPGTLSNVSAGPVIENLNLTPGNYYLVASSTDEDFEVYINVEDMPCPEVDGFAFNPQPADNEDELEPNSVTLRWMIPNYATGWRLIFGSTYHPEVGHPQTIIYPEDGSFSHDMANSFTVTNLWNNTNYFWRVEFNNDDCPNGVSSPIWGFTTHLNVPQNLRADDETIFEENDLTLTWDPVVDRTYRKYFIYQDGVKMYETPVNQIGATTYTIPGNTLSYNMEGYVFYVTAVYDEGESAPSNTVTVKVSGRGSVNGYVYEQDGVVPIPGATVTFNGYDEFNVAQNFTFTTNNFGYYEGTMYAGSYDGQAAKEGYQTAYEPTCGNPVGITYDVTTTPVNFILDENFNPVCQVIAEYYPDSLDPQSPYVKVYWGCGLPGNDIIEDFETGDFSQFDWQVSAQYPWVITDHNPYEGEYCMKSGNQQVLSSSSIMEVTVNIPADGVMSFFGKISSEQGWDYGYFYIDGVQKGSYTGESNWSEKTFDITEGDHTFKWEYTEDFIISQGDDCFYVDYITFYRQPEPPIPGMTYDFENSSMQGWTSIDADGDGYGWKLASEVMGTGYGYNGSNDCVLSQSYDNSWGALNPNNYLVSPQVQLGGVLHFYACAQDANYAAEHFGVAVSTTSNSDPNAFTMLQEWTMTAKSAPAGGRPVKNSRSGRAQGTWYEYTVDLSAYSGMGYVAIRHFNCTDMFYLDVDNITIGDPSKVASTRSLNHYRVYRTNCYNDGPYTEENTVLLATVWVPDTVYIDVEWADLPAGVYKWGVGAVYAGNRGEMIESPITWAEPQAVNMDRSFSTSEAAQKGPKASIEVAEQPESRDRAYMQYCTETFDGGVGTGGGAVYWGIRFPAADLAAYNGQNLTSVGVFTDMDGDYGWTYSGNYTARVYQGGATAPGTLVSEATEYLSGDYAWHDITLTTPVTIDASQDLWLVFYTADIAYPMSGCTYVGEPNSDYLSLDGVTWEHSTDYGLNYTWMIRGFVSGGGGVGPNPGTGTNSNYLALPRESETVWSNCLDKDMYLFNEVSVNVLLNSADSPEGVEVSFRNYNDYEQLTYPMGSVTLDGSGYYLWESFRKGEYQVTVEFEGYETIIDSVSIWAPTELRYVMTEILYPIAGNIYVSRTGWAMWDGIDPGQGGGGGGQGGNGDTFSVDFEAGLPAGWTTIDGGTPTGYGWHLASSTMGTGYGHNGSSDCMISQSYDNGYGIVYPDNYLVSPQVTLAAGSTFSFYACAQDAGYSAEHFGVFVSDNGTSDWTMVNEWTIGQKGERYNGPRGQRDQTAWTLYSVDLSNFAGQKYIAIRHFNCSDQFYLDVDDIALTNGAKSDDRHFEFYKVMCTSIDGVPIYNHNTVWPFCQLTTDGPYNAPLVEGEHYLCKVAVVYSTGQSAWSEPVEWEYEPCDHWGPVDEVTTSTLSEGNHIEWVFEHGYNPYDPGTGGGGGGQAAFEWYYYDNGVNEDAIGTGGGQFWWAVMFPAGSYEGHQVTKVAAYDYMAMTGTASIYQGGSNAPAGTALGQTNVTLTGSEDFVEFNFAAPVTVDPTQNLWVVFYNASGATYPAAVCNNTGDANGRWVSLDGATWEDLASYGLDYTFMLRAYIGDGAKGSYYSAPTTVSYNGQSNMGGELAISGNGPRVKSGEKLGFVMTSENTLEFNIAEIANFDGRVYFLHKLYNDNRFSVINAEQSGMFIVSTDDNINLKESFNEFVEETTNSFARMDKYAAADYANQYKGTLPMSFTNSMMMDIYAKSRENNLCANALPFCTDEGMYEFPAGVNAGSGEPGPDYDCLYTTPNPAWYYMKISDPGDMDIYMYSTPSVDIDFCCWGPFDDPTTPCPNGLTEDKVVSCSYSAQPTEHCMIPAAAQTGEYYILVITNYSNQTCNINFSKVGGSGSTDCTIVYPTFDLIGFLITQDGEYLAIVGPEVREYTDIDEFGEHEYCVRPIYPGEMTLPDHNYGWSMGCPVCESTNGGNVGCAAGDPIHGQYQWNEGGVYGSLIWWGEQPQPAVFEWYFYDNGVNEDAIGTNGGNFWWGVKFPAGSYTGNQITKVAAYDYMAMTGTVTIYNDGANAPATAVGQTNVTFTGAEDFVEFEFASPVNIDPTKPVWVVLYNGSGATFPAAVCANTGDANGRWVSLDGSTWEDLASYGLDNTFMVRAYIGSGAKGEVSVISVGDQPAGYGTLSNAGMAKATPVRAQIVSYNIYRSTEAAGPYDLIANVPAEAGQTYYEYFDEIAAGDYYYQVTAVYDNGCESDPAMAFGGNDDFVLVTVTSVGEDVNKIALYPNPTNGNVKIEAKDMTRITVVSVLGQVVYDAEVSGDEYELNMGQYNAGVYVVRIATENGVSTQRVTVVK